MGSSLWGRTELDTTEQLSTYTHTEGNVDLSILQTPYWTLCNMRCLPKLLKHHIAPG